jgi:hypothetical protein
MTGEAIFETLGGRLFLEQTYKASRFYAGRDIVFFYVKRGREWYGLGIDTEPPGSDTFDLRLSAAGTRIYSGSEHRSLLVVKGVTAAQLPDAVAAAMREAK